MDSAHASDWFVKNKPYYPWCRLNPAVMLSLVCNIELGHSGTLNSLKQVWSCLVAQSQAESNLSVNLMHSSSVLRDVSLSVKHGARFTLNFTNSTDCGRKLSARRGNPLGVLWVICWCGTWALKHPGALQQRRVTVTLSGFTAASTSANRCALAVRRLHVETITETTALHLHHLWYLIRSVWLLFASVILVSVLFSSLQQWFFSRFVLFLLVFTGNDDVSWTWSRAAPWNRLRLWIQVKLWCLIDFTS